MCEGYLKQTWFIMLLTNDSDKRRKKGGREGRQVSGGLEKSLRYKIDCRAHSY